MAAMQFCCTFTAWMAYLWDVGKEKGQKGIHGTWSVSPTRLSLLSVNLF